MNVIEIKDLVKIYNGGEVQVKAVNGITIDFEEGEFTAVVGPSGSGKTTFLNTKSTTPFSLIFLLLHTDTLSFLVSENVMITHTHTHTHTHIHKHTPLLKKYFYVR